MPHPVILLLQLHRILTSARPIATAYLIKLATPLTTITTKAVTRSRDAARSVSGSIREKPSSASRSFRLSASPISSLHQKRRSRPLSTASAKPGIAASLAVVACFAREALNV